MPNESDHDRPVNERPPENANVDAPATEADGVIHKDVPVSKPVTLPSAMVPAKPPEPKPPASEGQSSPDSGEK